MNPSTIIERRLTTARAEPLEEQIELVAEFSVRLDDDLRTAEAVTLTHVRIVSRDWEGAKRDELRISVEQLHDLNNLLGELYSLDDDLRLQPEVEPTAELAEQPDASTGQTFTMSSEGVPVPVEQPGEPTT